MPLENLAALQAFMSDRRIDAWVLHDFRNTNSVFLRLFPGKRHVTRRSFAIVPAAGTPRLIVQSLDEGAFATDAGTRSLSRVVYTGWKELHRLLAQELKGASRIAMEYAPADALPVMDITPGGVIELLRSLKLEVVSSADLVQVSVARWGAPARAKHAGASALCAAIMKGGFDHVARGLRAGRHVMELEVAEHIRGQFKQHKLEWPDGPIVSVNAHAADPHYEPTDKTPTPIRPGDWLLIDLWARVPGDENIYSDITWTGFVGRELPAGMRRVFDAVRRARDASVTLAQESWKAGRAVQGWQLDDAARAVFEKEGLIRFVKHRTGHSLSPGAMVHGMGMNLDSFETQDTREMLPDTGFTVEPGLYLPADAAAEICGKGTPSFGVRNEINVYVDPVRGPEITSCVQNEPVLIA